MVNIGDVLWSRCFHHRLEQLWHGVRHLVVIYAKGHSMQLQASLDVVWLARPDSIAQKGEYNQISSY